MMIRHNSKFLLALVAGALLSVGQVLAQDELVVEWGDELGNPIPNALRNAIANDTLADGSHVTDRVYKLKRGGFYWNEDRIDYSGFHLRIVGETADEADPAEAFVCGDSGTEDCGPAIIQRVAREDLSIDGVMLTNSGSDSDLTIRNVWLMGQDSQGGRTAYEQIALNASDSDFWFDNVIFDKNDWHFLGPNSTGCSMYVTNSVFRNNHGPSQQWEGLGVRFEVGADTVMFENNTFLNIGFTPFQSEAAPMNFFVANHNTFVNIGRSFQAGNIWKEAYVTNNVFVNPFWHGEMPSEYNDPDREDPYTGFFGIGALPARFGTDLDRRVVLANNSFWRDDAFETYGADTVRTQPLVNDTTMGYFNAWDGMVMADNYIGEMADVASYPQLQTQLDDMISNIVEIRGGSSDATLYPFDPGRDEECFVCNIWPLPEDFSYTNATLMSGGTDGLPLGDLNWFPASMETYLANREAELAKIVALAGARITLDIIATVEGEAGALEGEAEIAPAEGFTYFQMDGGGFIEWTFDVPAEGVHSLVVSTHLRGNSDRGQRIFVNGTNIRNDAGFGEYFWSSSLGDPTNEWFESTITQAGLIEGADALNLPAGENTIRIEPSWGFQHFSGIQVLDAGDAVVADLIAPAANYEGVAPVCAEADWCPQGFNSALLGAGGSVTFGMDFAADGDYLLRIFYNTAASTTGQVLLDGVAVADVVFDAENADFLTEIFPVTAGKNAARNITITANGSVNVDFVQVLEFGTTIRNEPNELPEGYALEQNYPNPFNPSTTISYTLADPGNVTLTVYDVVGRQVARLVDGVQGSGTYHASWNGVGAASGVYFYRLQTPVGYKVRSMVLTK